MSFCQNCGKEVASGDQFCHGCGSPVSATKPTDSDASGEASSERKSLMAGRFDRRLTLGGLILLLIIGFAAFLATRDWSPDEIVGSVSAPGFNPDLVGGGLSSSELGSALLLESLQSATPVGFQILQDGVDEGSIDDFKQVPAGGKWTTEFRINGSDFRLKFKGRKEFRLEYPSLEEKTADKIFAIASRYGYLSSEASDEIKSLIDRSNALINDLTSRQLTVGVSESDLVAEASDVAAGWNAWLSAYGADSSEADLANAFLEVVEAGGDVAYDPTNSGISSFNEALNKLNKIEG